MSLVLFIDISFGFSLPSSHSRPLSHIHTHLFHATLHPYRVYDMRIVLSRLGNVDRIGRSRKIVPLTFFPELIFFLIFFVTTFSNQVFAPKQDRERSME